MSSSPNPPTVVWIRPAAPSKPPLGTPCNGCGLCCLAEPCPVGIVFSRRRLGACVALHWDEEAARYRCGLLAVPEQYVSWLPGSWTRRLAARWISAGTGCDAHIETT